MPVTTPTVRRGPITWRGGNSYGLTQYIYDVYTNYNYAVLSRHLRAGGAISGTNYATNIFNQYQYSFLNVVTNHYYTNSLVSQFITNISYIPLGSPDLLSTNVYQTTLLHQHPRR